MVRNIIIIFFTIISPGCMDDNARPSPCCDYPEIECQAPPAPIYDAGPMWWGRVDGLKNCLPFSASAYAYVGDSTENLIGMLITTYVDLGWFLNNKEIISIGVSAHQVGIHPFINFENFDDYIYYSTYFDHKLPEDRFYIDTTYQNIMAITSIDTTNDHITGWFDCRFVIDLPSSGRNPDTIIFNDCHFDAHEFED